MKKITAKVWERKTRKTQTQKLITVPFDSGIEAGDIVEIKKTEVD